MAKAKQHDTPVRKSRFRKLWLALAVVAALSGAYLLLIVFAPSKAPAPSTSASDNWNEPVPNVQLTEDRIYIPRLSLNLLYKSGGQKVLRDALWHRFPERGDPEKGGNFILAGHRFEIGLTPGETKRRSPLYHITKIKVGDYLYADTKGKRYQYEVTRIYEVSPHQTEIEASSETPKMTLYTCTLKGEADGREVVEAKLIASDVDPAGQLMLSSSGQ